MLASVSAQPTSNGESDRGLDERPVLSLVRLGMIDLDCSAERWRKLELNVEDEGSVVTASFSVIEESDDHVRLAVWAITELEHLPELCSEMTIVVPDRPRKRAEMAIQRLADLLSIGAGAPRSIRSPAPFVALRADNEAATQWLEAAKSFDFSDEAGNDPTLWVIELAPDINASLTDRLDGVTLLAEALSQEHPSGQIHDYVRLFERAFAVPAGKLTTLLGEFLDEEFRCSDSEIAHWIKMRNRVSHGDRAKELAFEPDARRVVQRMRQAAYDVLFNKKSWRSADSGARDLWAIPTGSSSRERLFATKDVYVSVQSKFYDPFGVYPQGPDLDIGSLPSEWWVGGQHETSVQFQWATRQSVARRSRGPKITS